MILKLAGEIDYDTNILFKDNNQESRELINEIVYNNGIFLMPIEDRLQVASNGRLENEVTISEGNKETLFDIFARPRIVKFNSTDLNNQNYQISLERFYIEQSTTWRMKKELITINLL